MRLKLKFSESKIPFTYPTQNAVNSCIHRILGENNKYHNSFSNYCVSSLFGGVIVDKQQVIINLAGEYDLLGELSEGNIIVSLNETDQATLNLRGVNITSTTTHPIYIESGNAVDISAKSDTINYIYDKRSATTTDVVGGAIYSLIDLDVKGKGTLYVTSTFNNGIASTKDLEVKNLAAKGSFEQILQLSKSITFNSLSGFSDFIDNSGLYNVFDII